MITAQDIREKTFEKATFGGYAMNEVDDFLDELASDLAASQKENDTLRAKMKILAAKIEEYRGSEEAMHLALVTAQKVAKNITDESQAKADTLVSDAQAEADAILSDAKAKADALVADAEAKAREITGSIEQQREAEELRLQKAQAAAAEYVKQFRAVLEHESSFLDSLESSDFVQDIIVTPPPAPQRAIAAPAAQPEAEPVEEPADDGEEDYTDAAPAAEEEAPQERTDYAKLFEDAVYAVADGDGDDAIPEAEDGDDAPSFRF